MSPCHPSYAGALLCCLGAPLRSQEDGDPSPQELEELSLEELLEIPIETVYGASKQEESALAAPSSVSVVRGSSVDTFGYRTLSDLLRGVRGVYVTSDRNYERLGVRGFSPPGDYNGRVLLLVDGHRTNEVVYDSALIDKRRTLLGETDGYARVDVALSARELLPGLVASIAVENVLDVDYSDPVGAELVQDALLQDGRTFLLRLVWRP
jgi:iron complex outermembrane receptor protein